MKKHTRGTLLITLGMAIFLTAAGILLLHGYQAKLAKDNAQVLLAQLSQQMQVRKEEGLYDTAVQEPASTQLPQVTLSGYDLVGIISIESLDLELPILNEWSYDLLQISPCRYSGSTQSEDLILLGHNYRGHFASLKRLSIGDAVTFCDVDNNITHYEVAAVEVLEKTQLDQLTQTNHALTLFTCTAGGHSRLVVRCDKIVLS